MRRLIGIVGGLGPLASTRFLSSIYRQFRDVPEQQTPRIVLYSDPTFPDRTTHFLRGEEDEILAQAVRTTESLLTLGVDHLLFCCYTIHRIAPRLPAHVLERFVSLLDLAVDAGLESQGKVLLLEPPEVMTKKIKRAVTDTETEVRYDRERKPGVANLLELLSVATGTPPETLAEQYSQYGPLKADTAAAVVEFVRPLHERFRELAADPGYVDDVLVKGADKAEAVAAATLARARSAMGLLPRSPG